MAHLTVVRGDITTLAVDAIVNAANNAMRGGGGVDGAIHRAGGPAILSDCIARFPNGLATGDAGWTTAGNLPARWVIHTVGPNYAAGLRDRDLLASSYRRPLAVAAELGARTIAFPLISAGVYGWPIADAARVAVEEIENYDGPIEVTLVAFDGHTEHAINAVVEDRRRKAAVAETIASVQRNLGYSPGVALMRADHWDAGYWLDDVPTMRWLLGVLWQTIDGGAREVPQTRGGGPDYSTVPEFAAIEELIPVVLASSDEVGYQVIDAECRRIGIEPPPRASQE